MSDIQSVSCSECLNRSCSSIDSNYETPLVVKPIVPNTPNRVVMDVHNQPIVCGDWVREWFRSYDTNRWPTEWSGFTYLVKMILPCGHLRVRNQYHYNNDQIAETIISPDRIEICATPKRITFKSKIFIEYMSLPQPRRCHSV